MITAKSPLRSGARDGWTVTEHLLELCADDIGLRQDVGGDEAEGDVTARESGGIPSTVVHLGAPVGVESAAVALDDEPAVDEQIHPPHSVDPHLQLRTVAERAQDQPHERLGSRLTPRIDEFPEHMEG